MKLAPVPSELLGMVLSAQTHTMPSVPSETLEAAANGQHSTPYTIPQTSPMTPHNRPPAHNLAHHIYYIRSSSRHHLHEDSYPKPARQPNLASPTPPALSAALLGFPSQLLVTLGISLASPHEQTVVRANPAALRFESGCEGLGARNCIAVANLLLQRLQMELARLDGAENAFESSTDNDDSRRQMRRLCVHIYRAGQRRILQENIAVLEVGVEAAFMPVSPLFQGNSVPFEARDTGTLLTLETAYDVLEVLYHEKHESVLVCLAAMYGLSYAPKGAVGLLQQFREMGVEEVAWAVWIGTVVKLREWAMMAGDESDSPIQRLLWPWVDWLKEAYAFGSQKYARVDDDGFVQHLLEVVLNIQTNFEPMYGDVPWSPDFVAACGKIVQGESLMIRFKAGSALGRKVRMRGSGQEQAEEHTAVRQEQGEEAEMTETVVMYARPGLEMWN